MQVVATAGHVDHGKSTLVLGLTGMDPDRFAEEKARGLTIDLGFAWTTLASGRQVAFVDVPGHVRFLKNMLAGVGAVEACLFVVAATEGWKPQSEEHLRI
ncbi:MAG: selenocysteine-specific elongation factor, partial [Actinomycetota bacterium]|nr:selenocysteine-specific elongation factor [Actinomycetota bacterium]